MTAGCIHGPSGRHGQGQAKKKKKGRDGTLVEDWRMARTVRHSGGGGGTWSVLNPCRSCALACLGMAEYRLICALKMGGGQGLRKDSH